MEKKSTREETLEKLLHHKPFDEMTYQELGDHLRKVMEASGGLDRALAHLYEFEDQEIICNGMTEDEYNGVTEDEYNGKTEDEYNGMTEDECNGVTEDEYNGKTEDEYNGKTEDEYNGMTEEEYEEGTIREICSYRDMDPNTFPRMTPEERERYHKIRDDFIEMQNQKNKQ